MKKNLEKIVDKCILQTKKHNNCPLKYDYENLQCKYLSKLSWKTGAHKGDIGMPVLHIVYGCKKDEDENPEEVGKYQTTQITQTTPKYKGFSQLEFHFREINK